MKLKTRLILYLLAIHIGMAGLVWLTLKESIWLVVLAEFFLLVSLIAGRKLVLKLLEPLHLLESASRLFAEEPFGSQLISQGVFEMDQLIELYNRLLRDIHDEQLKLGEQRGLYEELIQCVPLDSSSSISTAKSTA